MKESEAFYRYAKALFRIQESEELDTALSGCVHLMQEVPQLTQFLAHPQIALNTKMKVLHSCIQHPLLVRFWALLIERKHTKCFAKIAQEYHRLLLEKLRVMEAQLVTVFPADKELIDQLKTRLEEAWQRPFRIQTRIDPTLIGGALLFVGNHLADYSFKGRLNALKDGLLRNSHAT